MLSIIIPVYNEAENIQPLLNELNSYTNDDTEYIFVDDGSKDETLATIEQLALTDKKIKCLSLSRNFGHQNALMAGMQHCKGDVIITMDGDLQHPPSLIPTLLKNIEDGFDVVQTKRIITQDIKAGKKILSSFFYKLINLLSDTSVEPNVADFKAFNRKVLKSILQFNERELFLRGIFSWIGFKTTTIDFEAPARKYGQTKYSFGQMMKLGLKGITSFSFKPLRLALLIGSIISIAAFSFAIYALIAYINGNTVPGWASTIIAIMLLGGTQLLAIGLLGEYIASLFIEAKKRPLYLVDRTINLND